MSKKALAIVGPLIIWVNISFGSFPEYEYFSDTETTEVNSPRNVSSEYESDRLTYQFLSDFHSQWLQDGDSFQYTAGSLGPTRFYTRGRFRFRKDISENFGFQLAYVEVGDFKQHRENLVFEFYYRLLDWLNVAVYGTPSTLKKQDDVGFATDIQINPSSHIRFFYTNVDFSFNKRNEENDRYIKAPASYGLVYRKFLENSHEYVEASLKKDQKLDLNFSNGHTYEYEVTQFRWISRHSLDDFNQWYLQTEFNAHGGFESDSRSLELGVNRWESRHLDGLFQVEQRRGFFHQAGLRINYAFWKSQLGHVLHNDLLPHAWFNFYEKRSGPYIHRIDTGLEMTWHRGRGNQSLRSEQDNQEDFEYRMNARYRLVVSDKTHLNLLLTFDLDRFGSGETWEGGALQYSMSF